MLLDLQEDEPEVINFDVQTMQQVTQEANSQPVSLRRSIQSSDFDDEMFVKMTGLRSLKENNIELKLRQEHPSLEKKNKLKVADFF